MPMDRDLTILLLELTFLAVCDVFTPSNAHAHSSHVGPYALDARVKQPKRPKGTKDKDKRPKGLQLGGS